LLPSLKRNGVEMTKIPTGGINVNGRDYLSYMTIREFTKPGHWITNYNGVAYSDDGGQTWTEVPSTQRMNTPALDDKFQMIAYSSGGGFVHAFGNHNGRFRGRFLPRGPAQR